jgi:hypothetical protein
MDTDPACVTTGVLVDVICATALCDPCDGSPCMVLLLLPLMCMCTYAQVAVTYVACCVSRYTYQVAQSVGTAVSACNISAPALNW